MSREHRDAPLVMHLVHRLAVGGLENGVVNLINCMPAGKFRHVVVCLTDATDFQKRISRPDTAVVCLNKHEGKDWAAYWRLWRLLRRLRPDILHTRTMATLDGQIYALLAGVPGRVHGEHGQVSSSMRGAGFRHKLLRHLLRPVVQHYTAVSMDLANYLVCDLGIPRWEVTQVYNGVDSRLFHPRSGPREQVGPPGFIRDDSIVIGTVGRLQPVKDQACLVRAFLHLTGSSPVLRDRLRLILVGGGPLLDELRKMITESGAADLAWLPGERTDIPELLRAMDIFVLPSLAEGTCNTILEAMATGLPVIATAVGGNPELVDDGRTGRLVPPADAPAIAECIRAYAASPAQMAGHGMAGRRTAEDRFSLQAMVNGYMSVYEGVLARRRTKAGRERAGEYNGLAT